jgi:hypothetical protein
LLAIALLCGFLVGNNMKNFFGGSIFLARKTVESDIFFNKPDKWFKIWMYLLLKANYRDNKHFKRGECFTTYEEIRHSTKATLSAIDHCIRWLKSARQITTRKATRGFYVFILNFAKYQSNPKAKSDTEARQERKKSETESETEIAINKLKNKEKIDTKAIQKAKQEREKSDTTNNNVNNNTITNVIVQSEINDLIALFKNVNPSYKQLFKNKTERSCLERLLKEIGREQLEAAIKILETTNKMDYAPVITTPYHLEKKIGNLMAFVQKQKLKVNNKKVVEI